MTSEVLTSEVLKSNTNIFKTSSLKSRKFLLTLNEPDKYNNLKEYLTNISSFKYLISSKEKAPTTGHEHFHIFFYSSNPIKLSLKKTQGANIVLCNGTPQEIKNYVVKDGDIIDELGTEPHQGKKNFNYEEIKQMTTQDILNIEDLNLIQKKTILNIKNDLVPIMNKNNINKSNILNCVYLYGKDKRKLFNKALSIINDNDFDELNFNNGFFIGASNNCKYCILNNFDPDKMPSEVFYNFIDLYAHNLNVKNKCIKNFYENIIILSDYSAYDIYNKSFENLFLDDEHYKCQHIF